MKINILPKRIFDLTMRELGVNDDNVESSWSDHAFISINDSVGTFEVPYFGSGHANVLRLFFDDVEKDLNTFLFIDGSKVPVTVKAFDGEMAGILYSFIWRNQGARSFTVHCTAGVSRSGAVGTFLNDMFDGNFEEFKRRNPHIHPNPTVMRLMNAMVRSERITEVLKKSKLKLVV